VCNSESESKRLTREKEKTKRCNFKINAESRKSKGEISNETGCQGEQQKGRNKAHAQNTWERRACAIHVMGNFAANCRANHWHGR